MLPILPLALLKRIRLLMYSVPQKAKERLGLQDIPDVTWQQVSLSLKCLREKATQLF